MMMMVMMMTTTENNKNNNNNYSDSLPDRDARIDRYTQLLTYFNVYAIM